jgi:hypothetical protein
MVCQTALVMLNIDKAYWKVYSELSWFPYCSYNENDISSYNMIYTGFLYHWICVWVKSYTHKMHSVLIRVHVLVTNTQATALSVGGHLYYKLYSS